MLCLVALPDSVVKEISIGSKAKGQDCLDQVCKTLGIIEVDYFGLQYDGPRDEVLWLNLRNPVKNQVPNQTPIRLRFRVKFFVPPHLLLQETARHYYFLHVKSNLEEGKLQADEQSLARICALIAQAESGDYRYNTHYEQIKRFAKVVWNSSFRHQLTTEHKKIKGLHQQGAEYRTLQEVAQLDNYGMEFHRVKLLSGEPTVIGVSPEGIKLFDTQYNLIESYAFPCVKKATLATKSLVLNIETDDNDQKVLGCKLISREAAEGLYRAVTEKHAFYQCDTVRHSVIAQHGRDFKGTLVSFFNENSPLGKRFVFDVQRTSREAYDHAQRLIYSWEQKSPSITGGDLIEETIFDDPGLSEGDNKCTKEVAELRDRLQRIQDAMTCKICCDGEISSAFCPCGHAVCCAKCALVFAECPICRSPVEHRQPIYLPLSFC